MAADGTRLPVFLTANVKTDDDGRAGLVRITAQDAQRPTFLRARTAGGAPTGRPRTRTGAGVGHDAAAFAAAADRCPPRRAWTPRAYYHPASDDDVGGDFYDLFPLARDKWGFFLGDVSGKGAGAAAVTSLTRYTLRAAAVYDDDPVAVLHNLDTVLSHEFHGDDPRFCTVIFGLLTPSADGGFDVELATGGHPPALLLGADGDAALRRHRRRSARRHAARTSIRFRPNPFGPGDTLVLYTDGLTEARIGMGTSPVRRPRRAARLRAGAQPGLG